MNEIKNTTMIWKRMNYSAQQTRVNKTAGIAQLRSSLSHSLRTIKKGELEFNEHLSKHNRIIYQGKIVALDSLSIDERKAIINDIIDSVSTDVNTHQNITKLKNDRSKYASKLKTLIKKDNEPVELKTLIQSVLNDSGTVDLSLVNKLDEMRLKRVKDKKSALTNYIELHNNIVNATDDLTHKKKTVIQESFFKFPAHNKINELKPKDYINIIYLFHRQYLPNYEVKACVFHGDEVLSKDDLKKGVHPHIFISGKNSRTGQYDLVNAQLELVNNHLRNTHRPELENNSFQSAQKIGEAYQEIIYQFVNNKLKEYGYSIEATVSKKTIEHKKKIENIKKEQNKSKVSRSYNLLNHTLEEINKSEKEKKKLDIENKRKAVELQNKNKFFDELTTNISKNIIILAKVTDDIETKKTRLSAASSDLDLKENELSAINNEIKQSQNNKIKLISQNQKLNEDIKQKNKHYKQVIEMGDKELEDLNKKIAHANYQYTEIVSKLHDKLDQISLSITDLSIFRHDNHSSVADKRKTQNKFKSDMYDIYSRLTPESRKVVKEDFKKDLHRAGLDTSLAELSLKDKTKLILGDVFLNKEQVGLDNAEMNEIKERRKLLRPGH